MTSQSNTAIDEAELIEQVVNAERYPLTRPGEGGWTAAVEAARTELREQGCTVLRDFVRPQLRDRIGAEGASVAGHAYDDVVTVNVYNTAPDPDLPEDHPARVPMQRGNAFVAHDRIPAGFVIHRLYAGELFQRFLAECLEVERIHPLADPLAGLCLNIVEPGKEHPWHFDTNEFAVSMLTQLPEAGGEFEYCPNIRSDGAENLADVRAVITGDRTLVRTLTLRPGDLQLFRGRFSLHRVSPVRGVVARHTAIFSYSLTPGLVGRPERTRQLFGRLTDVHRAAAGTRSDDLLD